MESKLANASAISLSVHAPLPKNIARPSSSPSKAEPIVKHSVGDGQFLVCTNPHLNVHSGRVRYIEIRFASRSLVIVRDELIGPWSERVWFALKCRWVDSSNHIAGEIIEDSGERCIIALAWLICVSNEPLYPIEIVKIAACGSVKPKFRVWPVSFLSLRRENAPFTSIDIKDRPRLFTKLLLVTCSLPATKSSEFHCLNC